MSYRSYTAALMADHRKFALIIQPMTRQGAIWQAILRSQQISVIWESPDVDLIDSLKHLQTARVPLPDLLLIDTRLQTLNPYAICRWRLKHCPEVKIVLINGAQKEITPSEREWALYQGASDLLPRFQRDRLMSGAVSRVRRILDLLDCPTLDSGALVAALIGSNRENFKKALDL